MKRVAWTSSLPVPVMQADTATSRVRVATRSATRPTSWALQRRRARATRAAYRGARPGDGLERPGQAVGAVAPANERVAVQALGKRWLIRR